MAPSRFAEHEKLHVVQPDAQVCRDFVQWLEQQGYAICNYRDSCGGEYIPANYSLEALLAQRFGIDLEALEAEKRAMLGLAA